MHAVTGGKSGEQESLTQCRVDAGPPSTTLVHHPPDIESRDRGWWGSEPGAENTCSEKTISLSSACKPTVASCLKQSSLQGERGNAGREEWRESGAAEGERGKTESSPRLPPPPLLSPRPLCAVNPNAT